MSNYKSASKSDRVGEIAPAKSAIVRFWASGILVALATLGSLRLGIFSPISAGLDASWQSALGEAAAHGEKFGYDLIFTGGPLSALYTRYFDSVHWPWVLLAGGLLAISLAWSCARLASTWMVAALLPTLILICYPDSVLISLPAFVGLAVLARPKASTAFIVLAAITTGALALAKFSVVPVAVVAFIAIDIALVRERRLPIGFVAFLAAMIGWFAVLQGGVVHFGDFVRFSVETSTGYAAAMSVDGSGLELHAFIALAAGFAVVLLLGAFRPEMSRSVLQSMLATAVLGVFCFIGFKAGFIRHDLHSLIGWGVLALASAAYAGWENRNVLRWLAIVLSVTSAATASEVLRSQTGEGAFATTRDRLQEVGNNLTSLTELALNPRGWVKAQQVAMTRGRAAVRAAMPLPKLKGSVDALPSIQSAVIAAGLDYRPRFTIQEYTTYTKALIAKNRESWFGRRSPDHILFSLDPIDGRYPNLSEGPLWPELLRFYEPTRRIDKNLVVLSRRQHPLSEILGAPITRTIHLGERFAIDPNASFLTLDIRTTWLGRFLSLMFKPPLVHLQLQYANGSAWQSDYKIIPAIAREGFIISPRVETADDFIDLSIGDWTAFGPSSRPVSARIVVEAPGSWAYDARVSATFRSIDTAVLKRNRPEMPNLKERRQAQAPLRHLLDAVPLQPPWITRVPEGLLVHAPRRIVIPITEAKSITVTFGLRDGAWKVGKTEGACFQALTETGLMLWKRCLDPRHNVADRGPQEARFALPSGQPRIVLQTLCRQNCDWAWSYWGGYETSP
ncbi:MAG: hypothetical protein ACYC5H_11190 [Methylovirgula sp.]